MAKIARRGIHTGSDGVELEQLADNLLRDAGELGYTVYTELQLTRQDVRHETEESIEDVWNMQVSQFSQSSEIDEIIIESAWADIKAGARRLHISDDTLKMIEMRRMKFTYADIALVFRMLEDTVKKRVLRAEEKMMSLPEFGMWETINEMTRCIVCDWWRIFWAEIKARENNQK